MPASNPPVPTLNDVLTGRDVQRRVAALSEAWFGLLVPDPEPQRELLPWTPVEAVVAADGMIVIRTALTVQVPLQPPRLIEPTQTMWPGYARQRSALHVEWPSFWPVAPLDFGPVERAMTVAGFLIAATADGEPLMDVRFPVPQRLAATDLLRLASSRGRAAQARLRDVEPPAWLSSDERARLRTAMEAEIGSLRAPELTGAIPHEVRLRMAADAEAAQRMAAAVRDEERMRAEIARMRASAEQHAHERAARAAAQGAMSQARARERTAEERLWDEVRRIRREMQRGGGIPHPPTAAQLQGDPPPEPPPQTGDPDPGAAWVGDPPPEA